jgi:hypothetical protein
MGEVGERERLERDSANLKAKAGALDNSAASNFAGVGMGRACIELLDLLEWFGVPFWNCARVKADEI